MNPFALTTQEKKRHAITWLLLILVINVLDPYSGCVLGQIIGVFVLYFYRITTYYIISLYILPKYGAKNKLMLILYLLLMLLFYISLEQINHFLIIPSFNPEGYIIEVEDKFVFSLNSIYSFTFIATCSFVLYLNKKQIQQLRNQSQKEQDLLNRELLFLKNQFNNHLTFNFLNYCYSFFYNKSEKAACSIETYSEILSYSLKAPPCQNVLLQDEVDYIENFIELQRIISTDVNVSFNCSGNYDNKYITPHILISLVEEAFAKGEICSTNNPIEINIHSTDKQVVIKIRYEIKQNQKELDTHVQLDINEMLRVFYNNKHLFKVGKREGIYSGKLIIYS